MTSVASHPILGFSSGLTSVITRSKGLVECYCEGKLLELEGLSRDFGRGVEERERRLEEAVEVVERVRG